MTNSASCTASERIFSTAGDVCAFNRSSLLLKMPKCLYREDELKLHLILNKQQFLIKIKILVSVMVPIKKCRYSSISAG